LQWTCRHIFSSYRLNWRLKASDDNMYFALFWQATENRKLLSAVKGLLDDFRSELRDDERERHGLQQQYALDKAAWEVEMTELKCHLEQVLFHIQHPGRMLESLNDALRVRRTAIFIHFSLVPESPP